MRHFRIWRSFLLTLSAIGVSGCAADAPTAPRFQGAEASPGLVSDLAGGLVSKNVLERTKPLSRDVTASAVIGREGGTLSIPAAGFHLTIPPGAVTSNTKFTVTAIKGSLVAYEFWPHGTQFERGLIARQDLAGTEWQGLEVRPLVAGYFAERSALDLSNATAVVTEVIAGVISPLSKQFTFGIDHFSGYVVAW